MCHDAQRTDVSSRRHKHRGPEARAAQNVENWPRELGEEQHKATSERWPAPDRRAGWGSVSRGIGGLWRVRRTRINTAELHSDRCVENRPQVQERTQRVLAGGH